MRRTAILLPLALAGAACGNDAIDPVTGGEGSGATGFAVLLTDHPGEGATPMGGELEGSIRVSLRNDADALVELGIDQDVLLELQQGSDSLELGDVTRPPTGTYVAVQIRFEGADATVFSGSVVGDTTLTNDAVLVLGTGGLATVEIAALPFDVDSESELDLVLDLNSELWITRDNIAAGTVSQADLTNSVTLAIP